MTRTSWGLDTPRSDEWRDHAACGPDTAEWFWLADSKGPAKLSMANRQALALCGSCPVVLRCYQYELANPQPWTRIAGGVLWQAQVLGPAREVLSRV